ncbi:dATP/dGTP diphosphohydrolase domain-containing protein [Pseudovibrio ascidiaceicola]|uniref:dATP/dGTP diphosphohydrolase domain-containing protein n=1 Tax=Pseudovibrio ascidiaceicola TaxID=285279 RepID=UPI003D36895B
MDTPEVTYRVEHKTVTSPSGVLSSGPVFTKEEPHSGAYPDNNPKAVLGTAKPSLSVIPPVAIFHLGQAMEDGEKKYGLMNWRENQVSASVYYNAALRHLMAWWDGEQKASDSGVHHLAHVMGCMAILLDAESMGNLIDDRPRSGMLPAFIKANTKAQS